MTDSHLCQGTKFATQRSRAKRRTRLGRGIRGGEGPLARHRLVCPTEGKLGLLLPPQRSKGENGNAGFVQNTRLWSVMEKNREEHAKFFTMLERKEVEDDFMRITGQQPLNKPKKRKKSVWKQLEVI
ncbi:hypothetical protein CDL15_Pgr016333 [Punica granatum]|nr:hypothetical protein CDL15_Pgr016333 [Punica granatum]